MSLWSTNSTFADPGFYSTIDIKPSKTLSVSALSRKMQNEGHAVIDMSVGEPDYATPANIRKVAMAAIEDGMIKYTDVGGTLALKRAIVQSVNKDYGIDAGPENVIASSGAKQSIYNIFAATLNQGDEVIIPTPYWTSYPDMVALSGGTSAFCKFDQGNFSIDLQSLRTCINPKTKWLILNSPSNPTGAVYSREFLRALADILLEHPHVHILSDDIYRLLSFDGTSLNIGQVEPRLWPRIIIVNGVSKSYAMTGWRLGFAVGHAELIKRMTTIQSHTTSCPSSISQVAATEALVGPQDVALSFVDAFRKRRDDAFNYLEKCPMLTIHSKPQGAFYLFPCLKPGVDDVEFASFLLNKHLVASVPGSAFGTAGYLRFSYALSDELLRKGCAQIVRGCEEAANKYGR